MNLFLRPKGFGQLADKQAYEVLAGLGFDKGKLAVYKRRGHSADWVLFNMRLGRYKVLRTTKDKFREYFLILRSAGYIRCDLDTRSFAYAKLMNDIGIKHNYITGLDDFKDNSHYENYSPISDLNRAEIDLMIENRLMPIEAAFVRGFYGLDSGVPQSMKRLICTIIYKDCEIKESKVSKAELGRYSKMFDEALALLKEIEDDRFEMIKKLAIKLYDKVCYDVPLNIPIGDALRNSEDRAALCECCDKIKKVLTTFY